MTIDGESVRELKHQLRTPVNHIIGYSELMMETADDLGEAELAEHIRVLQSSGQRLTRQIEQMLPADPAEVTLGDIDRLRVSFSPILEEMMAMPLLNVIARSTAYTQDLERVQSATRALLRFAHNGCFPDCESRGGAHRRRTRHRPEDTSEEVGSMIETVAGCTPAQFKKRFAKPGLPVILSDQTDTWPARTLWSPQGLAERFGDRKVEVRRGGRTYLTTLRSYVRYLAKEEAALVKSAAQELLYMHALVLKQVLPELLQEFSRPLPFGSNWIDQWPLRPLLPVGVAASAVLFVGPAGAGTATHRDRLHTHAWLTQLHGEKQFWLIAPQNHDAGYVDRDDSDRSLIRDLDTFDPVLHDRLNPEDVLSCVIGPGQTLYIPAGWWHQAKCLNTSVSLSENFVNKSNYAGFQRLSPLGILPRRFARGRGLNSALSATLFWVHSLRCSMLIGWE